MGGWKGPWRAEFGSADQRWVTGTRRQGSHSAVRNISTLAFQKRLLSSGTVLARQEDNRRATSPTWQRVPSPGLPRQV